jgi:hypothetical protein
MARAWPSGVDRLRDNGQSAQKIAAPVIKAKATHNIKTLPLNENVAFARTRLRTS